MGALFKFKSFSITYYGIYFSIGFILFLCNYWFFAQTLGVDINSYLIWSTSLGYSIFFLVGTKLLRILKDVKNILNNPWGILKKNGNSFYGGVFGLFFAAYIFHNQNNLLLLHMDLIAISLPIFQVFIRLGCASYGCCFGKPYNGKNSICYQNINSPAYKVHGGTSLHPTQIYSVYKNIVLLTILYLVFFLAPYPGLSISAWCITYSILRFVIDFTRDNSGKELAGGLRKSQKISILTFIVGLSLIPFVEQIPYSISLDLGFFTEKTVDKEVIMALITSFIIFFTSFAISFVIKKGN